MAKSQVTIPLGIPDIRVLKTEAGERGELINTVESTRGGTACHKCGQWITKVHGRDEWVTIRHLPVFGCPSYLRYHPKRYQGQDCEGPPTTTEKLAWHDANSSHSFAYDNHILLQLVNSTIADGGLKEGISSESVAGTLERRIEAEVDWSVIREIEILGLDEMALKKGQRDDVTWVTGQFPDGEIPILGVLSGPEKAEVVEFLRLIPQRILQTIQAVCCDLWEVYLEAVRQEIPTARIVADRFHVARHYREAAAQIRKEELRRLKKELSKEDYQKLNGSYHAFRKNAKDLNKEERKTLRKFFEYSPDAKRAYDFLQALTALYDMDLSKKQAQAKILGWIQQVKRSGLPCFDEFIRLLGSRWQEIANFFVHRENSGFVEGFNNRVKVLKRRCYGIFNLSHWFQRIYLDLCGYRLFAATTIYA